MSKTIDPKVYDLADEWLSDLRRSAAQKRHVASLAQTIQQAIEDWESDENPRERGDDDGVEYADPRDARDGRE